MSFKLLRPIKTNNVSQDFSSSKACARVDVLGRPIKPWQIVSQSPSGFCPVGYKKFYPLLGLKSHGALDLTAVKGEPVYFSGIGESEWEVMTRNDDPGYGLYLEIRSLSPLIDGKHVKLIYVHALKNLVAKGDKIKPGQHIQDADSTGASSGHHVHLACKLCDEHGNTINKQNGYNGAIDPAPYWDNTYVVSFLALRERLVLSLELARLQLSLLMLLSRLGKKVGGLIEFMR